MNGLQQVLGSKKAFIFDLFHTLTALEITSGGRGPSSSEILGVSRADWNAQLLQHSTYRLTGKLTGPSEIIRTMAHAIDRTIPEEKILQVVALRERNFRASLREMPAESCGTLQRLKAQSRKVALLSNADVLEAAGWAECPAAGLFDVVIFSCHVGWAKPEPEIYLHCLERLGVKPEKAVFVGDGGSDELAGAQKVGLTTILMAGIIRQFWPEWIEPRRAAADFVVERLAEIA